MQPTDPRYPTHKTVDTPPDQPSLPAGAAVDLIDAHAAVPPPVLSAAPSLSTLANAFRRAWKWAVPVALLGAMAAAAGAWQVVPPIYSSVIVFRIQSRPPHGSLEDEGNFANVQKAQVAILKSYDVLSAAIEKSRAAELYGVQFAPLKLQKKLTTAFNDGPEVLSVGYAHENPEAVAALLNALGEVYPKKVNAADDARIRARIAQLRRRLHFDPSREPGRGQTLAEQLRDRRIELSKAEKDAGLDDKATIVAKFNHAQLMMQNAQRALQEKKLQRTGLEADLAAKQARVTRPIPPVVSDSEVEDSLRNNPEYAELVKSISQKRQEMEKIARVASDSEKPRMLRKPRGELRALEEERQDLLEEGREKLRVRLEGYQRDALKKEIAELKDRIEQAKTQDAALEKDVQRWAIETENYRAGGPKAPPEVEALRDQVRQLEKEYDKIGNELASLEGALPLNPRVTVHAAAFVPTEKEYNRPIKFAVGGGLLTFGLLLGGACLLEARGRRVYASQDVMQGLGLPVLATLPALPASARSKSAQAQSLGGLDSQFGMTEAVDALRTMLLHAPGVDGARVVMITSASDGEGKTTLASHLAASLARAWRKTLLIDGDLRHPAQHTQFDQPLEPGLAEALRGEVEFDEVARPTLISRLWIMSAGRVDAHALQALAQEAVGAVFDHLKEQYDFIVLDSSPVLPVPDALLFGKQADVVLLSVMRDHSRIPAVYQASQRLETLGIRVLGTVVIGEKTETYGRAVPYPKPGT